MKKAFVVYGIAAAVSALLATAAFASGEFFAAGCFIVGTVAFGSGALYAYIKSRK